MIDKFNASGECNLLIGVKLGIQLVKLNQKNEKKYQPIIVFLTDGKPTKGETYPDEILRVVSNLLILI